MKRWRSPNVVIAVPGASLKKMFMLIILGCMMMFMLVGALTSLRPEYRPSSSSLNNMAAHFPEEMFIRLFGLENRYFLQMLPKERQQTNYSSLLFRLATSINPDDPRSLLGSELPGFALYDSKILIAGEGTDYTNIPYESAPPLEVMFAERQASVEELEQAEQTQDEKALPPPKQTTQGRKVVYIYHTHTRESYLPALKGVTDPNLAFHRSVNVTKVGEKLMEELEKRGIGAQVNKTDIEAELLKKGMTYTQAYNMSRQTVVAAMKQNRDLQYFIDIHRDARRRKYTTTTINGVDYARVAFIVGGENAEYEKNLQLATELHHLLQKKYPGLSRGVIKKQGAGTNGKFNQDLSRNAILVEFGGVDNTFAELFRSATAFADVFSEYYWQAEKVEAPAPAEKK
ncbi:stage II sporulation protein P [Geobacillus sp. FSL K6-0789]|uniref:Stage II sporulation protein P n=1 Tax=Geobacillus stearothermophilus TaxID=1422 RepID=A0A0K9HYU1_GEOSE|nr:stage II sporulation protein P [Geobacillus stearothermophilus]KMY62831.1 stage II sporulation protein P [Geobacillus stearothermophilus]KMY64120.1 stage II sporulation protein P [Geobacillus stearothermophilus]MED3663823.1 stage II sporulation protein P [Geobacillus stearothermophilus]MED3720738.1 stage II sporulation protein P [Geobacillus stearothermophilus]MED4870886.1 stage II sporulation protein P [Geobacillus stearothermophilus]